MKNQALRHAILALAVIVSIASFAYVFAHPPRIASEDFDAFYCAANVSPADPYRYEPLHSCEMRNLRPVTPNAVVPAPLPPYAIAAFAPLARVSYAQATLLWWLLLVASAVFTIWALVELTGLPFALVSVCIVTSVLLQAVPSGALAPVPIAALTGCALALARERWNLAALLLGVACIEPHMTLPPALAVFLLVPRMRSRLALVAVALGVTSLAVGGARLNWEYVATVLPAHAVSELGTQGQYSLSSLLHAFGLSNAVSVGAGSAQYAIFVLLGLWLAFVLRREAPEGVVLAPLACAVTGGTFVHLTQIAAAVPLALVVAAKARSALSYAALTLLAIPWQSVIGNAASAFAVLLLVAVLVYRRVHWAITLGAAAALSIGLWLAAALTPTQPTVTAIASIPGSALAEVAWRALADQFPPTTSTWISHALTYVGLACVYASAFVLARVAEPRPEPITARV